MGWVGGGGGGTQYTVGDGCSSLHRGKNLVKHVCVRAYHNFFSDTPPPPPDYNTENARTLYVREIFQG